MSILFSFARRFFNLKMFYRRMCHLLVFFFFVIFKKREKSWWWGKTKKEKIHSLNFNKIQKECEWKIFMYDNIISALLILLFLLFFKFFAKFQIRRWWSRQFFFLADIRFVQDVFGHLSQIAYVPERL